MEQSQVTNGERIISAVHAHIIGTEPEVVAPTNGTKPDLQEKMTAIETVVEQMSASLEQAKDKIDELTATLNETKTKTEDQVRSALEKERAKTEKRIKAAVDEATSKPQRVGPRNLVVCIDGTSNQFGPKVRLLTSFLVNDF